MSRHFPKPIRELLYYGHKSKGQVVVFDGQSYRRQDVAGDAGILNSFDSTEYLLVNRVAERRCEPGSYPWDFWQKWALEDGVDEDLAGLGRSLIREADQHNWDEGLRSECGWADDGQAMLELALKKPEEARKRWQHLMETDGERGFIDDDGEWQSF